MLVGYSITALLVAAVVMSQPHLIRWLLTKYRGYARVFLLVMPVLWIIDRQYSEAVPTWPWASTVPMVNLKPGDMPVHLGAIAALSIVGLTRWRSLFWPLLVGLLLAVTGAMSRGGLVAFSVAFGVAWCFRPGSRWARGFVVVMALAITAAAVTDVSVKMQDRDREFSARQLLLNVVSVVASDDVGDLNDTKTWRLEWWEKIADYTIHGEYFWAGKGFGVNLASDDGFQVNEQESLRSPHNGHMNILARTGVPGLLLWIGIQIAWLIMMGNAYLRARNRQDDQWSAFFVLLLAYWAALMFNAAVDVYFEGPMGGVWYWSIIGLGIGASGSTETTADLRWSIPSLRAHPLSPNRGPALLPRRDDITRDARLTQPLPAPARSSPPVGTTDTPRTVGSPTCLKNTASPARSTSRNPTRSTACPSWPKPRSAGWPSVDSRSERTR